jgi:hypothetical protein
LGVFVGLSVGVLVGLGDTGVVVGCWHEGVGAEVGHVSTCGVVIGAWDACVGDIVVGVAIVGLSLGGMGSSCVGWDDGWWKSITGDEGVILGFCTSEGIMSSASDAGDNDGDDVGYRVGLKTVVGIAVGRKDGATTFMVGETIFLSTTASKVTPALEESDEDIPESRRSHNIAASFMMFEF